MFSHWQFEATHKQPVFLDNLQIMYHLPNANKNVGDKRFKVMC